MSSSPDAVGQVVNEKLTTIQQWAARAADAAKTTIDAISQLEDPTTIINFPDAPQIPEPEPPVVWIEPIPTLKSGQTNSSISESTNSIEGKGTTRSLGDITNEFKAVDVSQRNTVKYQDSEDITNTEGERISLSEPEYQTPVFAPTRPTPEGLTPPPVDYPQQDPLSPPEPPGLDAIPPVPSIIGPEKPELESFIDQTIDNVNEIVSQINEIIPSELTLFDSPLPLSTREDALSDRDGAESQLEKLYSQMTQAVSNLVTDAETNFEVALEEAFKKYVTDVIVENESQAEVEAELLEHQKKLMQAAINEAAFEVKLASDAIKGRYAGRNYPGYAGWVNREVGIAEVEARR